MDEMKMQIQRQLTANYIADRCLQYDSIIYSRSWSSQERIIRFTTPFFRNYFSVTENGTGKWKTGDPVMYEFHNTSGAYIVDCVFNEKAVTARNKYNESIMFKALNISQAEETILSHWDLTPSDDDVNKLFEAFDLLLRKDIPYFETILEAKIEKTGLEERLYEEGTPEQVISVKYERNPVARAACIAAHGTSCKICGFDFGKEYGSEFEGKIEVHHKVPISEIGEKYIVDPVKDLIPVCSNCHTALHSKKNGVYTVEELKKMWKLHR